MKLIKLTNLKDKKPIYINIECIGHIFEVEATNSYGSIDKPQHTRIGVITHNNGGFEVTETFKDIIKLIESKGFIRGVVIQ
jgi:hypothetical protein